MNNRFNLLSLIGARFSFVATRNGLTRIRHHLLEDPLAKRDALAFAKKHARAVDETYYTRTVDYNLLHNESAVVIQVNFNTHSRLTSLLQKHELEGKLYSFNYTIQKQQSSDNVTSSTMRRRAITTPLAEMSLFEQLALVSNSSIYAITTQTIVVGEASRRAAAAVVGVFSDYPTFLMRFFNTTNNQFEAQDNGPSSQPSTENDHEFIRCGSLNDTTDCLLIDNNGFIVASEQLDYIGRHLRIYEPGLMQKLVELKVYSQVSITDNQAICEISNEVNSANSQSSSISFFTTPHQVAATVTRNIIVSLWHSIASLIGIIFSSTAYVDSFAFQSIIQRQLADTVAPNRTLLRPCIKNMSLYEALPIFQGNSQRPQKAIRARFVGQCDCNSWFVVQPVHMTNLQMLIVGRMSSSVDVNSQTETVDPNDRDCLKCSSRRKLLEQQDIESKTNDNTNEATTCSKLEFESKLHRRKPDTCYSHHKDEIQIHICGGCESLLAATNFGLVIASLALHLLLFMT